MACIDMCINMSIDVRKAMCMDMNIGMRRHLCRHGQPHTYRHVCRYVKKHVSRPVYTKQVVLEGRLDMRKFDVNHLSSLLQKMRISHSRVVGTRMACTHVRTCMHL